MEPSSLRGHGVPVCLVHPTKNVCLSASSNYRSICVRDLTKGRKLYELAVPIKVTRLWSDERKIIAMNNETNSIVLIGFE